MKGNEGVTPSGSGLRPYGAEPAAQSQAEPLVPNAMIERLTRVLFDALMSGTGDDDEFFAMRPQLERIVRAFLRGMRDPSDAMKDAGAWWLGHNERFMRSKRTDAIDVWEAMIDAAQGIEARSGETA